MQVIITYLTFLFSGFMLTAQNSVEVTMTQFKNSDGVVQVGLYNQSSEFLETEFRQASSKISQETATVTFLDVPDGTYAISCYHDADSNGKLDMFMGMFPTESYGCSNNARGFFGPPKWEDAKFEIKDGEVRKMIIRM